MSSHAMPFDSVFEFNDHMSDQTYALKQLRLETY